MDAAAVAQDAPELLRVLERLGVRSRLPRAWERGAAGGAALDPRVSGSLLEAFHSPALFHCFRAFLAAFGALPQAEFLEACAQYRRFQNPRHRTLR